MNTIEQQLWDYIDGSLDADQVKVIEQKIASDADIKTQYEALLNLNLAFDEMDLEEPSMSFTRNVMENVALQPAPLVLKTKVDQRIIKGIAGFFILSILALVTYVISQSDWSMPEFKVDIDIEKYLSPTVLNVFFGVDLILALLFADFMLRKKLHKPQQ